MPVIALSTIIIGEHDFEAIEDRGQEREQWFRIFWELPKRIPDKDTFRRLLRVPFSSARYALSFPLSRCPENVS
jgi:hypothetical protein